MTAGTEDVRVARRTAHERLELRLLRQGFWHSHCRSRTTVGCLSEVVVASSALTARVPYRFVLKRPAVQSAIGPKRTSWTLRHAQRTVASGR